MITRRTALVLAGFLGAGSASAAVLSGHPRPPGRESAALPISGVPLDDGRGSASPAMPDGRQAAAPQGEAPARPSPTRFADAASADWIRLFAAATTFIGSTLALLVGSDTARRA